MDCINSRYRSGLEHSLIVIILAILASCLPFKFCRIWGLQVLLIILYGVLNDILACRVCIEYFTVGHFYDGENTRYRLVTTLDPLTNAVAWGIFVTARLAAFGCLLLALKLTFTNLSVREIIKISSMYLIVILIIADVVSRLAQIYAEIAPSYIYLGVPLEFQSRWHANNIRNSLGYIGLIGGGLLMLISKF